MSKKRKSRKRAKRPLDLNGLKEGYYGTIGDMSIPPNGHGATPEMLHAKIQQTVKDLLNTCPDRSPVSIIVEWQSEIRCRAVVMALSQGALVTNGENISMSSADHQKLEASALAEAEEIAAATRQTSQSAIDVGNGMASAAERRHILLDEAFQILRLSPDELVSRSTYGRARGPEANIYYPDGKQRSVGGSKVIPATTHSRQTFDLQQCNLKVIKPDCLELTCTRPHEGWGQLQGHTPGIDLVKGEADSPIHNSLLVAAKAGIRVDMTVCVTERISTGERWCTPISIRNKDEVFAQSHEWLAFLQESLTP